MKSKKYNSNNTQQAIIYLFLQLTEYSGKNRLQKSLFQILPDLCPQID